MDNRRDFLKKASLLSSGAGLMHVLPSSIARALAIDPAPGSTFLDAEHIVFLMQENRSFDHTYGTLQGVRGFNDPRPITLPDNNPVWLQSDKNGRTYYPFRLNIKDTNATWMSSLPHSWTNQVDARNDGKYDKWLDIKASGNNEYKGMPLTLGYYTRADLPFYYSLADAFTICDQHFCSSLTGTTPNRLYFWTGTIREKPDENTFAHVWNEDADHDRPVHWKTFPERLEEWNISWKIYQNELSLQTGFQGEEESWLSNFGDNPMEYFTQYHAKLHPEYIADLPHAAVRLAAELKKKEEQLASLARDSKETITIKKDIDGLKKQLERNESDQKAYTLEKYDQLTPAQKSLHQKAFSVNRKDPFYRQLTNLAYKDGNKEREMKVPKGDVLYQFREDVKNGTLPTVSWIAAPENFSDHPSAAWYGAWYISEVMDILTQNPEVWKKTIFVLTYDENDGYFDHVPPFVAPHPRKEETGRTTPGVDTGLEYVTELSQQSSPGSARISPTGLGYRVPMVIASPWSRGGWVCSQVFDHTSSLQFLEKFLSHKSGKKIEEPNISAWRRIICGDLTAAFRPYRGEKITLPVFVKKDPFLKSIHQAKFKSPPSNFRQLTKAEITQISKKTSSSPLMPVQEKGTRASYPLPYELFADGNWNETRQSFDITFSCGNRIFGAASAGSPFQVYAMTSYLPDPMHSWNYAVAAGNHLNNSWPINDFNNRQYHLRVYGPNGFFREFRGNTEDPLQFLCAYQERKTTPVKLTGNILLNIYNPGTKAWTVEIIDHAYKNGKRSFLASPGKTASFIINTSTSHGWYDFSVQIKGNSGFEKRYAGRVETGVAGRTDPKMGGV